MDCGFWLPSSQGKGWFLKSVLDTCQNVDEKMYIGDDIAFPVCGTSNVIVENVVVNDV